MAAEREWLEKDYYKILGVAKDAAAKEITKTYRKLARELHPDANPDDPSAEERYKEVSSAYAVLSDEAKRKEYDEVRRLGPMAGGFGGGMPGGGGVRFDTSNLGDLGDLFGSVFNRGRTRGGATHATPGADIEADLHLSFLDSVQGLTTKVHLTGQATCQTCSGSGAAPGTSPVTCNACHGRGAVDDDQGFFSFSRPCPQCGGRGQIIESPCGNCGGVGLEHRAREIKVRIPAGVNDGQRIRLRGKGEPGRYGGPRGDLYVRVHVAKHKIFGRKKNNVTVTVPITFAEAALGGPITVPTVDGDTVTLKIPAGTPSGKTFRVKGRGVTPSGKPAGSLLVTVAGVVPTDLSDEQRAAVEQLAANDVDPRTALVGEAGS
ncbi:MAG: molecular chaperone DnaJ [Acidimicrobiales bacterium]|nr:molecular chaperone DnaJ [Acidimicrobiales bacterium]